jgi:group II intron reverse transcriptase/maturase
LKEERSEGLRLFSNVQNKQPRKGVGRFFMELQIGKTIPIEYEWVVQAYQKVRQGGKASGIDNESWTDFEKQTDRNLYVIWNRLASGSYYPQPLREVEIPKKDGRKRKLGIPTLRDRIAQQVVKEYMEARIDKTFHKNSYGYRPLKSTHQAIEEVRQNCYKQDWVIDMDISSFFDEIDHELMLRAVSHVMEEKWVKMYIERWLKMPVQQSDGSLKQKQGKGTPQGGVISPLLANLYLHFTLDAWLSKHYRSVSFVRYADDIIIHCKSKEEAEEVLKAVKERLAEVKLRIKEEKTAIIYCKDYRRKEKQEKVKFDFLGFSYQPRGRKSKVDGKLFMAFTAEISQTSQKKIKGEIRSAKIWSYTQIEISEIAKHFNPKIRGWINYYGIYSKRSLRNVMMIIERKLMKWISKKYKINGYRKTVKKLKMIKQGNPKLFYHWQIGLC